MHIIHREDESRNVTLLVKYGKVHIKASMEMLAVHLHDRNQSTGQSYADSGQMWHPQRIRSFQATVCMSTLTGTAQGGVPVQIITYTWLDLTEGLLRSFPMLTKCKLVHPLTPLSTDNYTQQLFRVCKRSGGQVGRQCCSGTHLL